MRPILFLREANLVEIPSDLNGIVHGVAYGMDSNTVLHAFTKQPQVIPSGQIIECQFINSTLNDFIVETQLNFLSEIEGNQLVIFIHPSDLKKSKGYFKYADSKSECDLYLVPEKSDLYTRSKGLLETSVLAEKKVGIIGLGSGGSPIAVELAKAGISKFVLIDFDRIELSNVSRHICGVNDLGRLKTFAVRDAVLEKNPYAEIETLEIDVNEQREACIQALSKVNLIICASDNDQSRFLINEIALKYKIPAIFGRAITRATGGDVLRVRPFEGPCYSCLYSQNIRQEGSDDEEISQKGQAKKLLPDYTSENEIQTLIQVGLSSDIAPISNFMVKLALVELSKGLESGIKSLEEDLVSDFYIWANRRENIYEGWMKLEHNFNKPSILRWYGAKVSKDPNCMVCGI